MKYTITLVLFLLLNIGASAQIGINFVSTDTMPELGDPVSVDVTVADFNDIVNLQFWVAWDSTVMAFDTLTNLNEQLNMDLDNFNFPGNPITVNGMPSTFADGRVAVSWQDAITPQTLDDDEVLFTIELMTVGCGSTDMIVEGNPPFAEIEVFANFMFGPDDNLGIVFESLAFNSCPGPMEEICEIELFLSEEEAVEGEEVCVTMTVDDFTNMESLQGGIFFDNTVLEWTGFDFDVSADFQGVSESADGELSFIWVNDSTTLPDGSTFLKLTFEVLGSTGDMSPITFGDASATVLEALSTDGFLEICTNPGTVTVVDQVIDPVILFPDNVTIENESNVCIPIIIDNFISVSNMQFAVMWDSDILCYTGAENLNTEIGIVDGSNINPSPQGDKLNVSWVSGTGGGITVPGQQVLFEACFDVKADCVDLNPIITTLMIVGNPNIEISGEMGGLIVPLPVETSVGTLTIECTEVMPCSNVEILVSGNVTDVACRGGSNGSIVASPAGGTAPYTCVWTDADGNMIEATDCTITGLAPGTYSVDVSDSEGCGPGTATFTVVEPTTSISVTASATDASCTTGGAIATAVDNGVGNIMYNWSGGLDPVANPTNVPAGNYSVVVTDGNGCTASTSVNVGSSSEVSIGAGTFTDFSCNGAGTITPVYTGGSGNYTYTWSDFPPSGPFNLPARVGLNPGPYSVTVTDTETGCTDTRSYTIGDEILPLVATAGNTTDIGCDSNTGSYTFSVSGGCPDNFNYTCVLDGGTPDNCTGSINGLSAGNHTLVITDGDGRSQTLNFSINGTVEDLIILNPGGLAVSDVVCNGDQTGFLQGVSIQGGCPSADGYTCSIGGIEVPCDDIATVMLIANDYNLVVEDSQGNMVDADFTISEPAPILVTEGNVTIGDQCTNAISVDVEGGNGDYVYMWTFNGDPFMGGAEITDLCPGEYCLDVEDTNGCPSLNETICIPFNPTVEIEGIEVTSISDNAGFGVSCSGICDAVIIGTQTAGGMITSIELVDQDGNVEGFQTFPLEGVCAGTYTMTVTDEFGGVFVLDGNIVVTSPDPITAQVDTIINEVDANGEGAIEISVEGGAGGYTFVWTPDVCDGLICTDLSEGIYSVDISDVNGCGPFVLDDLIVRNDTTVIVDPGPQGPCFEGTSMITPNGDGVNDAFVLTCLDLDDQIESYNLGIFDRWGRIVLETDDYNNLWGTVDMEGNQLLEGGYYWVLDGLFPNGDRRIIKGAVTLLRD